MPKNLPEHTEQALKDYIDRGVPVGGFLHSVLSYDLFGAVNRADNLNLPVIKDIVNWVIWHAPEPCYGSEAKVLRWIEDHPSRKKGPKKT